jgi:DNA-binding transcriptional LysR family regulator
MKMDQLVYFMETARQEHIGKASRVLGISPSAISHSIAALEDEFGYKLFEKKGKNIVLTDRGRKVVEQSQDLIQRFQNLKQGLTGENSEKMLVRVAASHGLSHLYVAKAWAKISQQYPLVTLELLTLRSADVVKAVLNREIDFGICFSPQAHPELEMNELYRGELVLAVQQKHPVMKLKAESRIKALNEYPAVLPKAFQGIELCTSHPMFEKFGLKPKVRTATDSYDIALELLLDSQAWGFLPELLVENSKRFRVIKPVQGWRAPFQISSIHLSKRFVPKFVRDFETVLNQQLKNT